MASSVRRHAKGENISFRRHLATACVLSIALIAGVYAPASIADDAPLPAPVETIEPETDIGNFMLAQIVKYRREKRRRQAANPPRRQQWMCIHRYERHPHQGWATATGNGYYGGLQMDISFQRTYAPELLRTKGTANKWTALEQIWVAERAYRSGRGFYPWPNTARACGLL